MSAEFRLSLAFNVVLLGVVAMLLWREPATGAVGFAAGPVPDAARPPPEKPIHAPRQDRGASPAAKLDPAAVAQLEQRGFSRDVLVAALLEDFNRGSARRAAELQKKFAPRLVPDRELVEFGRREEEARVRELRQALGEDGYRAWDKEQVLREMNRARVPGDELRLTDEEAEQAYRLQKDFNDKARELEMAAEDGVADRADVGALQAQAQQALDRALAQLLGPQRFEELRGNVDPTAAVYRTYGDLNPTPDQAKAVLQADAAYRDGAAALTKRLNDNPADAANALASLKAMSDAREASLRQIFGADAYDNLKLQSDPTYKTLRQYAGAWDLSDSQIQSVYQTLHAFEDQATRTRESAELSQQAGQHVNWREIDSAIEQARQQTQNGLQNLVGAERTQRLLNNGLLNPR